MRRVTKKPAILYIAMTEVRDNILQTVGDLDEVIGHGAALVQKLDLSLRHLRSHLRKPLKRFLRLNDLTLCVFGQRRAMYAAKRKLTSRRAI